METHAPPPDDDEVARAIVRVLSGDVPEREEIELRRWLNADPDRCRLFQEMRAVWDGAGTQQQMWDTSALRKRIIAARQAKVRTRVHTPRLLALAASIVVLVGVGVWYTRLRQPVETVVAVAPLREVSTKRGQRATVQLPDGSRITLGAASTVRYPEGLDTAKAREVHLAGEAYFEVTHDAARPFVVRTAIGVARDLGTKFLVRAHDDISHVDVVVVEGLVSLAARDSTRSDSLLLRVADLGRLDSAGNLGVEHKIDLTPVLAWTRGQLVFRNESVVSVVAQIARAYDVNLRIADPMLRDLRFSGSFGAAPPAEIVADFARSIGASVTSENGGFALTRNRTAP